MVGRLWGGGARTPMVETAVCCERLDDFDGDVPIRVSDLLEKCLSVLGHVDDVLPDVSPVVSARGGCCADVLAHSYGGDVSGGTCGRGRSCCGSSRRSGHCYCRDD